jgi:probable phosphoglycerate mutase
MSIQHLLESIAALSVADRQDLISRLREIYGVPAPAPLPARQIGLALGDEDWVGTADFLIVFDGGSLGNPGAGYGSYAFFEGSQPGRVQRLEFPNPTTNNEAEYQTLMTALRALADQLGPRAAGASLEVRGDSQLVIQQVLGHWKAKDARMHALRDAVRSVLGRFGHWRLVQQRREDSVRVLGH